MLREPFFELSLVPPVTGIEIEVPRLAIAAVRRRGVVEIPWLHPLFRHPVVPWAIDDGVLLPALPAEGEREKPLFAVAGDVDLPFHGQESVTRLLQRGVDRVAAADELVQAEVKRR